MIELSSDFRSLASKIYTFSFLCFGAKVLRITSVDEAGLRIEFENTELVAGALATVAALMTVAALLKLLSDGVRTRLIDDLAPEDLIELATEGKSTSQGQSIYETHLGLIRWTAFGSFLIEAIVPLTFGATTSWYAWHDVVQFVQAITIG